MLPDVSGSACGHSRVFFLFFRRALESTHNNFAIYCGLVMVHCRCYIGLECTILFLSRPTQWVVGHYGHWPTHKFYNKAWRLGLNNPCKMPFWRRTFLRWSCQHFYTAASFIKKYDWQGGHWISPQCFPKFYPTNCPVGISTVSNLIFEKKPETDASMMRKITPRSDCNFTTISYKSHQRLRLKNNLRSVAASFICESSL